MKNDELPEQNHNEKIKNIAEALPKMVPELLLSALFIVLIFYNFTKGLPIQALFAIFFGYMGVIFYRRYRLTKSKQNLFVFACETAATVYFTVSYFFKTW